MFKLTIKDIRLKLGMTQKELADELGVSQSFVSKVEKEGFLREVSPTLEFVEDCGRVFRVCPIILLQMRCEHCSVGIKEKDKRECAINTKCLLQKRLDVWQKSLDDIKEG